MNVATLTPVCRLTGHTEPRVWHLTWTSSGETLASCGEDRSIRLWAAAVGGWHCVAVLEEGHQRTVRWCAWSPDSTMIASSSFDTRHPVKDIVSTEPGRFW